MDAQFLFDKLMPAAISIAAGMYNGLKLEWRVLYCLFFRWDCCALCADF